MNPRYLIPLVLGILLFGCTSSPDPKQVMLESIKKSESLGSMSAELTLNTSVFSSGGATVVNAEIKQYVRGNRSRADIILNGVPELEGVELRVYAYGNDGYLCGKRDGWDCIRFNETLGLAGGDTLGGSGDWSETSRKLVESDAIRFLGGVQQKTVAGRQCSLVQAEVDYKKAASLFGFSHELESMTLSECLDEKTGIALEGRIITEMQGNGGSIVNQVDMYVKRLETGITIPEDMFVLPE